MKLITKEVCGNHIKFTLLGLIRISYKEPIKLCNIKIYDYGQNNIINASNAVCESVSGGGGDSC